MVLQTEINRPGLSIVRVVTLITVGVGMFVIGALAMWAISRGARTIEMLSPVVGDDPVTTVPPNPYAKYSFLELEKLQLTAGPIKIESLIDSQPSYASFLVSWDVPNLESGSRVRVTGQMNVPQGDGPFPVIVMLRGYADREIYFTGLGTRPAAAALARNGYITIAPDFQGYGGSGPESDDILVARFSRPLTVLQLLRNLQELRVEMAAPDSSTGVATTSAGLSNSPADTSSSPNAEAASISATLTETLSIPSGAAALFDTQRLGMWAHSNGGQIALSVLEITNRAIPTTLWAPVSQPFPYSVLFYSNETPDGGKYLRGQLAHFEFTLKNKPEEFSVMHRPERILGPIQIHQGGNDEAVPLIWSQWLVEDLQEATVEAQLFTYPAANHNMQPNWDEVVQRDLLFFTRNLR